MEEKIIFRAVLEVLGRPKEHVEEALNGYLEKINKDKAYNILNKELAEIKKQENNDLWATFAEIEVETAKPEEITRFGLDYMPSVIELIQPKELVFTDGEFSLFLNDLQGKLHHVDMIAKKMKFEYDHIKQNMHRLLRNYITVILGQRELTADQISKLTGIDQDKLEDYLDKLIDEGHIDLKEGKYFLVPKVVQNGQ